MITLSRAARSAGAAVTVAGIILGLPALLWALVQPVIDSWSLDSSSITDALLRPDDGTLLTVFLAAVGACTWLVLMISIVGELVAAATHRSAPRIELPGFRLGRSVAAALVAALLGAGTAVASPVVPGPAPALMPTAPAVLPVSHARQPEGPVGPVHVVQRRDTLWRIAEATLGDPHRWHEIYDLNQGRTQPDGDRLTEASQLTVGWRLVLPPDARDAVRVEAGDTLTGLAAQHLGDPSRAGDIFAANAGVPQADGAQLLDPDILQRGWMLALPTAGAAAPPTAPPPAPQPESPVPTRPPQSADPAPATSAPADTSRPTDGADVEPEADDQGSLLTVAALGVSSIVAGGVLASLVTRRRRQLRRRPMRHRVPVPDDDGGRIEWSLPEPEPDSAAHRLDLALRAMTHPGRYELADLPPPIVGSVRLTDADALVTTIDGTELPAPFAATGDGYVLDAEELLPVPTTEAAGCCAPFPMLVTIATDDRRSLMIDLEQRVVLRIGGSPARCLALVRHIAAELATGRTAEDTEVLLVDMGDDLPALNPERLAPVVDVATALNEIERLSTSARSALQQWHLTSAAEGRLHNVAPDSWLPTALLIGRELDGKELDRLTALVDGGLVAIAVVIIDHADADLRVGDDGLITLTDIQDGPWNAAQYTDTAGSHLAALLTAADATAVPVSAAPDPEAWATGMSEDGSIPEHDAPVDVVVGHGARWVDPEAIRRLDIVEHQDPHLDRDLESWRSADPPAVPLIAILGEPVVRAPGAAPPARPSWFAEVLVYLSLHPSGVTAGKAVTDLWPDGHRISPATIRHAFYGARKWAGRGLGDDADASFVSDMQSDSTYRLRGHLLDWDLFRRLRKRGQARHGAAHPGSVADYEAALGLVRGPVLSALRPGGYAWLNNHDQRYDLQIPGFIVDTAHELVDIALDIGDTALARRAAELARTIDIDVAFDRPLIDLMRIAHAEDNRSELELYASMLLDARGFDVPEELAPDSFAVLNELLPSGPRRPRA